MLGVVVQAEQEKEERRERNTTRAPSLNGPRFSPVGLGKGTKQRVRVSKFLRERERQKSPASSLERPAVYLEILGFSINNLRERQP